MLSGVHLHQLVAGAAQTSERKQQQREGQPGNKKRPHTCSK